MPFLPPPVPPSSTNPRSRRSLIGGCRIAFFWLVGAVVVFKWLVVDVSQRATEIASWETHEAEVISARVERRDAESNYDLIVVLELVDTAERPRYEVIPLSTASKTANHAASDTFAPGRRHTVKINPLNRRELAFPHDSVRGLWLGYGGAGLCLCLGLRAFFRSPVKASSSPAVT